MPLSIRLTDDEREAHLREIEFDLSDAQAARGGENGFDKRIEKFFNAYRNRVKEKTEPWKGCSNVSMPIVARAVDRMNVQTGETLAPRGNFSTITPVPVTESVTEDLLDRAKAVGSYIAYQFRSRMNMVDEWERFSGSYYLFGNGFGIMYWCSRERTVCRMHHFPLMESDEETGEEVRVSAEDAIARLFENRPVVGEVSELEAPEGYVKRRYRVRDHEAGTVRSVTAEAYTDEDAEEITVRVNEKKLVKNAPAFETIDITDIYFSTNARRIEDARYVFVRHHKSVDEIRQGKRTGRWKHLREEDLEKLVEFSQERESGPIKKEDLMPRTAIDVGPASLPDRQDEVEGTETFVEPLLIWECFREADVDGDGERERVVFWVHIPSRTILLVEYLSVEYPLSDEEWPIVHAGFIPVGTRLLCIGVAEKVFPLLAEANTLVNNRNDANSLKISPGGFYRPGSGFPPQSVRWKPGNWLPLDNPQQDFAPYQPYNDTRDSIDLERMIFAFIEDMTVSSHSFGRSGTSETARGTIANLQQDATTLDHAVKRLVPALEKVCNMTIALLAEFGPEEEEFRVVGTRHVQKINREDLKRKYDFYFDIDTISANREIRRTYISAAYQAIIPLLQNPQLHPGAVKLGRKLLEALEIKEVDEILPEPAGFSHPPMDQDAETAVMLQGVEVEPLPVDDHQGHLLAMEMFEQSDGWDNVTAEWVTSIWRPHKALHLAHLRELKRQQDALVRGSQGNAGLGPGLQQTPQGGTGVLPGLGAEAEIAATAPGATFLGG